MISRHKQTAIKRRQFLAIGAATAVGTLAGTRIAYADQHAVEVALAPSSSVTASPSRAT